MSTVQHSNPRICRQRAPASQRMAAGVIFGIIAGLFLILYAASRNWLDPARILGVCGFQQSFQLPCPGCYITRSGMAFASGHIIEAFIIQPAGGFFCCLLVVIAVFSLLIAVFGIRFRFLHGPITGRIVLITVAAVVLIFACGWAVTLARALAE